MTVNGTVPGPAIVADWGDEVVVHVTNSLDQPTTMHHHGMFFNSSSWYDGAMGVSQWYVSLSSVLSFYSLFPRPLPSILPLISSEYTAYNQPFYPIQPTSYIIS